MSLIEILLVVVLVLVVLSLLPAWPYAANLGYAPSGVGLVILILLLVLLLRR